MKANFPVLGIDVGAQNIKAGWVKRGDVSDFGKVREEVKLRWGKVLETYA